ncbi:hypothetical protein MNBD_GAMMA12-763 [hydrothermal vent metagenome]|uniref:Lysine-N-methylase n=1 Tax=hydrothermal vent metagenome TaxID=652676 RepID=A0A3B0Z1A7_9ZZZZ
MKLIELNFLEKFECIGGDCPQLCCQKFKITVDADVVKAWSKLEDISGEGTLDQHIVQAEEKGQNFNYLQLTQQGDCELLTSDGWCQAQTKYGHDVLPEICRTYPRSEKKSALVEVKTATFSCPVVTQKVLFENNKLDYNVDLAKLFLVDRPIIANKNDKISVLLAEFVSAVFQLKKVPINLKLFYIAQSVGVMNDCIIKQGFNEEQLRQILAKPKDVLFSIGRELKTKKFMVDPVTAGSYWKNIAQLFFAREVKLDCVDLEKSPIMQLCTQSLQQESKESLVHDAARNNEAEFEHYRKIYTQILDYKKYWQDNRPDYMGSLLERYIISSFINKGFPLHPQDQQFAATLVFVMTVASAIQLALWVTYKESPNTVPSEQQLQQIFYHIESTIGHTDSIYQRLATDPHMVQINRYAQVFVDLFV